MLTKLLSLTFLDLSFAKVNTRELANLFEFANLAKNIYVINRAEFNF